MKNPPWVATPIGGFTPDSATGDYSVYQGTGQLFETKSVIGKRQAGLALFSLATIGLSPVRFDRKHKALLPWKTKMCDHCTPKNSRPGDPAEFSL